MSISKKMFQRLSDVKLLTILSFVFFSILYLSSYETANAADQENCLLCHQYPLLSSVEDNGTVKSYFVTEEHYLSSVHSKVRCTECHTTIKKIPHEKDGAINCTNGCHMTDPTIGRKFVHKDLDLKASAHDINYAYLNDNKTKSDFPTCISCHTNEENKLVLKSRKNLEHVVMKQAVGRCYDCHSNMSEFVEKNIVHILRRSEQVRTAAQIVKMCEQCHNNDEMNERHKSVNAIFTYYENYHGKIMNLGAEDSPTCIDCHINLGDSPHAIKSKRDPLSATHENNRGTTCTRADCHPDASKGLGKAYIHVEATNREKFPIEFYLMFFFTILTVGSFVSLMVVLILELIRSLFPRFTFRKKEHDDE